MSDLFGWLTDELGGTNEAQALASDAQGTVMDGQASAPPSSSSGAGSAGKRAAHPLLRRSKLYYQRREPNKPVGLENQGATCYLNSLLQALYLTPEFRALLYSLTDEELGLSHYHAHEAAEAEAKAALERMSDEERAEAKAKAALQPVQVSEERVSEYTSMGMERVNVVRALRRFPDASQSEALLDYLFTHDFSSDPPEPDPAASPPPPKARLYKRIPIEFGRFFAQLQLGSQGAIGTENITRSFGWDAKEGQARVQHDIQELYIRLMEALSGSIAGSSVEARMDQLYRGSMATRTTCAACGNVSVRAESLYNFHAHVKGVPGKNLRQSLRLMVAPEKLQGSNAYFCHADACKRKQSAWRQDCIATLPPLLTFALNRHEYNPRSWQRVKINDRMAFPLVLDMEPYHESRAAKSRQQLEADEVAAATVAAPVLTDLDRAIANSLKSPDEVQSEAAAAVAAAAAATANKQQPQTQGKGGKKGGGGGGGGGKKGAKGASQGGPDEEVDESQGLDPSVFDPSSSQLYDLFAVVVHSGGAHGGHYFAYVRDVIAHNNYLAAHPEAAEAYDVFARDPLGASSAAPPGPGQKAAGYSGDSSRSAHPSFWFELNDSSVSPISFDTIASQYGGKRTCAYILMYRHRSLNSAAITRGEGPSVPQALQQRVEAFNAQFGTEVAVYEQMTNEIEVELHGAEEFAVHDGQLYPADWDPVRASEEERDRERRELLAMQEAANDDAMVGFSLFEEEGEGGGSEIGDVFGSWEREARATASVSPAASAPVAPVATSAPPRRFVVDQRITVPELHERVAEFLALERSSAEAAGGVLPAPVPSKIVLNQLSLKMRPPHQVAGYLSLDEPLDGADAAQSGSKKKKSNTNPKTLEQLGFSSLQHLLLWDGASINGRPFMTGTKKDQLINLRCLLFGNEAVAVARATAAAAAAAAADGSGAVSSSPDVSPPSSPDRFEFFLAVSSQTNLAQLVSTLSSRLGLGAESLSLLAMHPVSKALKPLRLGGEEGSDDALKPLRVLGVANHSWLGVEVRAGANSGSDNNKAADTATDASLARQFFNEMQQCVRLVVVDELPADAPAVSTSSPMELKMLKSCTVLQLKQQVLTRLQPSHTHLSLSQFRLRKVSGLDRAGALLVSESHTLAQTGLDEDDMRVRVEQGGLPDPTTQLDVLVTLLANVSVGGGSDPANGSAQSGGEASSSSSSKLALTRLVDRAPFVAEKSWTIKQTKAALLSHFGLSHRSESSFCLYRGHSTCDERAKAFTNEFIQLAQMKLAQSEWLWLEEGAVPTSGLVQLEVVLCTEKPLTTAADAAGSSSSYAATSSPIDDASLSLAEWRAMQQPLSAYTPMAGDFSPVSTTPGASTEVVASAVAVDGSVSSAPSASTSSTALAASPNGDSDSSTTSHVFIAPRTALHLCPLFTLPFSCNDTLLDLKLALHSYPDSPLGGATSPAHLRVRLCTRADGMGKWLVLDEHALKKQGVSSNKRLLVQVLPPERSEQSLTSGAMLLRVCTAVPRPSAEGGGVRMGPAALQELLFDDGEYPQLHTLQRALASAASIPAEDVGVLKWVGLGAANKEEETTKDKKSAESSTPPASTVAGSDGVAGASSSVAAAASSSSAAPRGWVVLFPAGPDPSYHVPAATSSTDKAKGKQQQQQHKQKGQPQKGGKGSNKQQKGAAGGKAGAAVVPPWSVKFGSQGLHDDDVLLCVSLRDFGCADLAALSSLARSWAASDVALAGVAPPGYSLVEKERAHEWQQLAEWERVRRAAPRPKEIELKIEY